MGLSVAREGKAYGLIPTMFNLKGAIANAKGDLKEAEECFKEAASTCKDLGNFLNLTVFLTNLCITRQLIGDVDGAESAAREALRVSEAFNYTYVQGVAYNSLGQVLQQKGQPKEALEVLAKARALIAETGAVDKVQDVDMDIADATGTMGDIAGALRILDSVLAAGELKQDQIARFHVLTGLLKMDLGAGEEAKAELELGLAESKKRSLRYWEGQCLLGLSDWERKFGTAEAADRMRGEAERVLKECGVAPPPPSQPRKDGKQA
jgi:tetratricopeptide (TPR) repeat protein